MQKLLTRVVFLFPAAALCFGVACERPAQDKPLSIPTTEVSQRPKPSENDLIVITKKGGKIYHQTRENGITNIGTASDEVQLRKNLANLLEKENHTTFFVKFEIGITVTESRAAAIILEEWGLVNTGAEGYSEEINVTN